MPFEEQLAQKLSLERDDGAIDSITALLGCRAVSFRSLSDNTWSDHRTPHPGHCHEPLIQDTLLLLLRERAAFGWQTYFAILDGFLRDQRWQSCVRSSDDAIAFAVLLIKTAGFFEWLNATRKGADFLTCLTPDVCNLLNAWCAPETPFKVCPSPEDITKYLFGEVWYSLAIEGIGGASIHKVVDIQRPPFRHGTLPASFSAAAVLELPPMSLCATI